MCDECGGGVTRHPHKDINSVYRMLTIRQIVLPALLLLGLLLVGCGTTATGTTAAPMPPTSTPEEPVPTTPATPDPNLPPEPILVQAQAALAHHLSVISSTLILSSSVAIEWEDSSLGCPDPALSYLQVITPGFLLTFADAARTPYAIHTTDTGTPLILCDGGMPIGLPVPAANAPAPTDSSGISFEPDLQAGVPAALATQVQTALAQQLGITTDTLTLVRAEYRDWDDSSMGCPAPDGMYLQVITAGYLLSFESSGETYDLRVTLDGNTIIRCQNGQPQSITE